jgi:hypothetical protein
MAFTSLESRAKTFGVISGRGVIIVLGILEAGNNNTLLIIFLAIGAAVLAAFFFYIRSRERKGKDPLLSTDLFKNRTSNLGLATQNLQWLLLMGGSFVVSVFLTTERHYSAFKAGVIFTAATAGILISSLAAARLAKQYMQKTLIAAGFVITARPRSSSCSAWSSWSRRATGRSRPASY